MNLFERIQYKLNEEPNKSDSKGQNKKSSRNNKKFSDNISNKVDLSKTAQKPKRVTNRMAKTIAGQDIEKKTGDKFVGGTNLENTGKKRRRKLSDTTKGGPVKVTKTKVVKQSEVSKQAKDFTKKINKKRATVANYAKTREQLVSKRAEYGIDTQGKATKAGIEKFARRRKQSNLPLTKKDISAAKKSMVGTGRKGADVGKYGGKLSKQRYVSDTTFKKIQKKINIKNPVKTSPVTGGPIPLKGKELKDYKQQQQQQQQPQSGSRTRTRTRTNTRTNTGNKSYLNLQKEIEKIKKGLNNPVNKSFGDALYRNQTGIKTPPVKELEKIKPKVTTSTYNYVAPPPKVTQLTKLSKHLMKNKNKYAVGAGLALATTAALIGRSNVKQKEKKRLAALAVKKNQDKVKPVSVSFFLNKTGTTPKNAFPSTTKSTPSVYDKNYIKNLKSKTTTPYDSSKIASYAKSSMSSKNVKPPKPLNKKQSEKINQQVNKYVADRKVKS